MTAEVRKIPLDIAHIVLETFDIGPDSRKYQRWRTDDGFEASDLESVLSESPFIFAVDWRGWLQEAVEDMAVQLGRLDLDLHHDLGEDGDEGQISVLGRSARIRYSIEQDDQFPDVVAAVNDLISTKVHYRMFRSSIDSDGWWFGVLPNSKWHELDVAAASAVELMFVQVSPLGDSIGPN